MDRAADFPKTTEENIMEMTTANKFTANAKKVVELSKEAKRIAADLADAKAKVLECLAEAGVTEISRGQYRALAVDKKRNTLLTDKVAALLGGTIPADCFKTTEYTELRVSPVI